MWQTSSVEVIPFVKSDLDMSADAAVLLLVQRWTLLGARAYIAHTVAALSGPFGPMAAVADRGRTRLLKFEDSMNSSNLDGNPIQCTCTG